ncbi:MAG: hypothetical protein FJW64_11115 [Actinobacteria bacterium]|nr:hypothetical protein [Actinomycetota bacterium]
MERSLQDLAQRLAAALEMVGTVTPVAPPGIYLTLTLSGAIYLVDVSNSDAPAVVTRHHSRHPLLHDSQPLPSVLDFRFDATTGTGLVHWWKDDPGHYDDPTQPYTGTTRPTSPVLFVTRIRRPEQTPPAEVVDMLGEVLRAMEHPDAARVGLSSLPSGNEPSSRTDGGPHGR